MYNRSLEYAVVKSTNEIARLQISTCSLRYLKDTLESSSVLHLQYPNLILEGQIHYSQYYTFKSQAQTYNGY